MVQFQKAPSGSHVVNWRQKSEKYTLFLSFWFVLLGEWDVYTRILEKE